MRWTDEARAMQAERIRKSKPWLKSTGPKTEEGKLVSRMNAMKSGSSASDIHEYLADIQLILKEIF